MNPKRGPTMNEETKKAREFLLGESVNGWYIKELGENFEPTTFLDIMTFKVREVTALDSAKDRAIEIMREALEKVVKRNDIKEAVLDYYCDCSMALDMVAKLLRAESGEGK
jgi:hypothetical protein